MNKSMPAIVVGKFLDCVDIVGSTPKPFPGEKIYVSTGAVDETTLCTDKCEKITYSERPSRADLEANVGDVLFAKMQATCKTLLIDEETAQHIYSTGFFAVRTKEDSLSPRYLFHFLNGAAFLTQKDRQCVGATQKSLTLEGLTRITVPCPEIAQQISIADILDQADALIANYRRQLALLDTFAQSRFHELFGDMVTNSKQWPIRKLSDIAEYHNGLSYKPSDVSLEGTVVLRAGNIQNQALVLDDTVRVKIPIKERYLVKENDILMCARNGSTQLVGKSAIIPKLPEPMYFGAFMEIIRTPYPEYVQAFFQTPSFRLQIRTAKTTTINQITNQMMDLIELPFPPLSLIEDFNRQTTKLKVQKESIRTSLRVAETLKASMTQKFFK